MNNLIRCLILLSVGMLPLPAQTYTILFGFSVADGIVPGRSVWHKARTEICTALPQRTVLTGTAASLA